MQAKARSHVNLIAPNKDNPDMLDMAQILGYVELRRLRNNTIWPTLAAGAWDIDEGEGKHPVTLPWEPLDPEHAGDQGLSLMNPEGCRFPSNLETVQTPYGQKWFTSSDPIGNRGIFDYYRIRSHMAIIA